MMKSNRTRSCWLTPISNRQRKFLRLTHFAGILIILPILAVACSGNRGNEKQPAPYFPVQKEVAETQMLVLLPGKLEIEAGYIRVNVTKDLSALIIWPYGYSLKIEGREIWINNEKDQAILRVGDTVKLGGGFVDVSAAERAIGHPLPEDAKGPYFLANPVH